MTALISLAFVLLVQQPHVKASDALVDVLVWGADLPIDPSAYSPAVQAALGKHLRRSAAYRPKQPRPRSGEAQMLYDARVRYERRLAAVSDHPQAPTLAEAYVDQLQPCYEWEGMHECPEREAVFATEYLTAHPRGPFSAYLPLLAAHRWLCAAEAYEFEKNPDDAVRTRRDYEQAMAAARRSPDVLVRSAAEELLARGSCFPPR